MPRAGGNTILPLARRSNATASNITARLFSTARHWRSIARWCISSRIRWVAFATNRWSARFRVRGLDPAQAFTFTLAAVETNPDNPAVELDLLAEVYRKLLDDGRGEDDIIMLGDFQADENHLGRLGNVLGITAAIYDTPTTTRGTQLADNIIFNRRATMEFTGRAEVVDLMREFDLTMQQAQEISEHLPIWAEFSSYEGGQKGYVPAVPVKAQGGK